MELRHPIWHALSMRKKTGRVTLSDAEWTTLHEFIALGEAPSLGAAVYPEKLRTPVNLVTATSGGRFLDYV